MTMTRPQTRTRICATRAAAGGLPGRRARPASRFALLASHFRGGFTLNEVLIAMGILALGIVAVASLFPTAALLQREAVKETLRQNHIRSGDAILEGVGIDNKILLEFSELMEDEQPGPAFSPRDADGVENIYLDVFALGEVDTTIYSSLDDPSTFNPVPASLPFDDGTTPDMTFDGSYTLADTADSYLYEKFPVGLRSLPSLTPTIDDGTANPNYREREVFYVPLVRQGIEASEVYPDWSVYLFVLQPSSQLRENNAYNYANYANDFRNLICANPADGGYVPKVFRVPVGWNDNDPNVADPAFDLDPYLRVGQLVLGDNGKIYRISKFNPGGDEILLDSQTIYEPINDRDLNALWVVPTAATNDVDAANQESPLGDLRLLSNTVVRVNDF